MIRRSSSFNRTFWRILPMARAARFANSNDIYIGIEHALARQDLLEAVFSREKLNDLPVTLRAQLDESGAGASKLTVITHVDIHSIPFEKENGATVIR